MQKQKSIILTPAQVAQKVRRMAFEIAESHFGEPKIVLAGVDPMGHLLASMLMRQLQAISPLEVSLVRLTLDKFAPQQSEVQLDTDIQTLAHLPIIVVDDVLNTGRTTAYSLRPFLHIPIKSLEVAVLVDRGHQSFPIRARYVGYELSTTIKQHIEVNLAEGEDFGVYLY